jgi:hypothetical protein
MIRKNILIRYLMIGLLFLLLLKVFSLISDKKERNYQFKGVIEKIDWNEKNTPTVIVNGKSYDLSTNWKFNERLNVGDSLLKVKDSIKYKLIKNKTGEVIYFK